MSTAGDKSRKAWRPAGGDVQRLLTDLVAINSINPGLVHGAPGELEIAEFVAAWLESAGLPVSMEVVRPGRPNVYATSKNPTGGAASTLMINVHLDTVGVDAMTSPFRAEVSDGRLRGRGAVDTKGGLAAAMLAMAQLAQSDDPHVEVILAAVVDEEYLSLGSELVAQTCDVDGVIVLEPNDLGVCLAHLGYAWLTIHVPGRAAHGSRPEEGVDAITRTAPVLAGLVELQNELSLRPAHPVLGHGSVHASLISGGQEISSYPAECSVRVERRTLPSDTQADILAELLAVAHRVAPLVGVPDPDVRLDFWRSPLEQSSESAVAAALLAAGLHVTGTPLRTIPQRHWTDAALFAERGIPSVVFGPIGGAYHGADEWVDLASVADVAAILFQAACLLRDGS